MVSWGDGEEASESSAPSFLPEDSLEDYAPATCADPTFEGIAVGCPDLCRVHRLDPVKCVAFEGTNTGRIFYRCPVQNEVSNCGFVSWVDDVEWPPTMKNALNRLWSMYFDENNARIDDRIKSGELVKKLYDERNKIEKNYSTLMNDVKKFMEENEKKKLEENYKNNMSKEADRLNEIEKERDMLKTKLTTLMSDLKELKQVHRTQAEVMKEKELRWEDERATLKEEKKKLEYALFDIFKANDALKEKVKEIKAILES